MHYFVCHYHHLFLAKRLNTVNTIYDINTKHRVSKDGKANAIRQNKKNTETKSDRLLQVICSKKAKSTYFT